MEEIKEKIIILIEATEDEKTLEYLYEFIKSFTDYYSKK